MMNMFTATLSILDPVYNLFGKILYFFDYITGNYLFAIFLFALFTKLVFFPLSIKQQKNQVKQAKLRPKEMAIRKKYKGRNDQPSQQQMQKEISDMYAQEKYNPLSGCLPLLIQLPFLILLYNVITNPLRYISGYTSEQITKISNFITERGAGYFNNVSDTMATKITNGSFRNLDLVSVLSDKANFSVISQNVGELPSKIPDFNFLGIDLGEIPSLTNFSWLLIIPVLTFVLQFLGMKLTKKMTYQPQMTQDQGCSMKIMDYVFPLITTVMTFQFAALLGVYWMFQNVIGVLQQYILKKMYPLPVFTDEDFKNAERELKGKPIISTGNSQVYTSQTSRYNPNVKYRSLHRIDDEENEQLPDLPPMKIDEEEDKKPNPEAPKLKESNPEHKKK